MKDQLRNFDVAARLSTIAKNYFDNKSTSFDQLKTLMIDSTCTLPTLEQFNLELEQIKQEDTSNKMAEWDGITIYNNSLVDGETLVIDKEADLAEINRHYRLALAEARVLHPTVFTKELGLYLQSKPNRPIGEIKALNTIFGLMNDYIAKKDQIRSLEARLVQEENSCTTKLLKLQEYKEYKDTPAQLAIAHRRKMKEAKRYNQKIRQLFWTSVIVLSVSIPLYAPSLVNPLSISVLTLLPALIPVVAFIIILAIGIVALVDKIKGSSNYNATDENPDQISANEFDSKINTLKITIADEMAQYSRDTNNLALAKEEAEQLLEKAKNTELPSTSIMSYFSWFSPSAGSTTAEENTDSSQLQL